MVECSLPMEEALGLITCTYILFKDPENNYFTVKLESNGYSTPDRLVARFPCSNAN